MILARATLPRPVCLLTRCGAAAVARRGAHAQRASSHAPAAATSFPAAASSLDIFTPSEQHGALRAMVREFAAKEVEPQALESNKAERFNEGLFRKLGELGLLGLTVDEEYGGAGADATAVAIVHEELAASDPAFTLSYLAHSLLFANNLNTTGSAAQKAAFLPRACTGELLGGMCMSEPGAGTDVLAMSTSAVPVDGGAAWELSGTKTWITNGARNATTLGDVFLVYARTQPQQQPASGAGKGPAAAAPPTARAHSVFLVERGTPGFELGSLLRDKCGMRASPTAELVFDRVRLPSATHLVGAPGDAVGSMMRNLEIERLGLAAMSLGIARRCIEVMNAYARERTSFGAPLNRHGQVQRLIADSYAEYAAGRAYVYSVASRLRLDASGNRLDSDGVKLYAAPMATNVASRAIQVLGGNGYMGAYAVERLWRDAKLLEIGGGTTEAHQKNMTREMAKMDTLP